MKISICNELFTGWPMDRIFNYAAQLGYDGIEIAPYTLADSVTEISHEKRRAIRRAAEESGIEIIGLHWLLVKPEGLYINHPDEFIRIKTQEYIEALIHFCADIGGKVLIHGSGHQRKVQEKCTFREAWGWARETFEACLETARKRNVIYCIEPLTRASTNFINTVEEALRMVKEIRHPNFKMVFDCRSATAHEESIIGALLRALESRALYHVHVNDATGRGPGFGETKFTPILKTLIESGYQRHISVEVFEYDPNPETIASRSIGYLRGILESLEENG
ncbi:MAG TPA: sugar phosphate isomerase/epimerase family protein [Thermodesulfobacteriota bacterium]|nr:sugar phosphate isomerase/epimerase family protein [Thermodesulfobacteriota bacterium]